jgi:uncharacterized protein
MRKASRSVSPVALSGQGLFTFMRRHPLSCYFFLAYLLSWIGWLPLVLSQNGLGLLPFHLPPAAIAGGGLGPIGSSFIMTAITSGKAGLRHLLRRFIIWRVGVQWYVFAILGIPVLFFLGVIVIVPGAWSAFHLSSLPFILLVYAGLFLAQLFISPLAEEPGWRGFALPRLQERYGSLRGTLILACFWGCWHFPLFLLSGYNGSGRGILGVGIPFTEFLLGIFSTAMIITWVFNHTRGSLLIVMLVHAAIDSFPLAFLFPQKNISGTSIELSIMLSFCSFALLILIVTRGKLGYQKNNAFQQDLASLKLSEPLPRLGEAGGGPG